MKGLELNEKAGILGQKIVWVKKLSGVGGDA
jgi:hypothetical protein